MVVAWPQQDATTATEVYVAGAAAVHVHIEMALQSISLSI